MKEVTRETIERCLMDFPKDMISLEQAWFQFPVVKGRFRVIPHHLRQELGNERVCWMDMPLYLTQLMNICVYHSISEGKFSQLSDKNIEELISDRAMSVTGIRDMVFREQKRKYQYIKLEFQLRRYRATEKGVFGRAYFEFEDKICCGNLSFFIKR